MITRRTFLRGTVGLAGVTVCSGGLLRWLGGAAAAASRGWGGEPDGPYHVLSGLGETLEVEGIPFWPHFKGDRFVGAGHPPWPELESWVGYGNPPPPPSEEADIVIVGGGLGGLCTAYLLREHRPVVLEYSDHFGGAAQAEVWEGFPYSLGGAYVITPDEPLASLYRELGLRRDVRVNRWPDPVEYRGRVLYDFWDGEGSPPEDQERFRQFGELLYYMGNEEYPDIPLPEENYEWILELDRKTFQEDIEERMGGKLPHLLEAAIRHYCFSSFGADWSEISAAGGWNFLAAEPFGQWVWPGGTARLAEAMWQRVLEASGRERVRSSVVVCDVRFYKGGVLVTYGLTDGSVRSILARRVVLACPKFVCLRLLKSYLEGDPAREAAMSRMEYRAYVVANVLIEGGRRSDFYDLFVLKDGVLPAEDGEPTMEQWNRPTDVIDAAWTLHGSRERAVLTLYWPFSFTGGRIPLLGEDRRAMGRDMVWRRLAEWMLPTLEHVLKALRVERSAVRQVRMARWGHALPVSLPGFIGDGLAWRVREPIDGKIFFVQQDNWALPAVENTLLDAFEFAPQVAQGL